MSVNSKLKASKSIGQRKAFYRQRIPESSWASSHRHPDIDILVTSRNGDRKNHESYQNNDLTSLEKKEVEPVEPVLKNIYQSNTYKKDLSSPHLNDEPTVQEKQQVKDQHSCIVIFTACLTVPSGN